MKIQKLILMAPFSQLDQRPTHMRGTLHFNLPRGIQTKGVYCNTPFMAAAVSCCIAGCVSKDDVTGPSMCLT